ncbi:RNA methyltransferase [Maribacter sp. SA7]|uniref:TrmH family RNA methyltransferase n=1 Tax=Maribacter zhoushanensis TaxID=3030012 RepID=UPI0023EACEE4|nr:RNA methyltransferase [Maribacter zhoushanensis]MDF4204224.1 RNA methyltransferase [Maribacter zhoushanensis]
MQANKHISSVQNPLIKKVLLLKEKSRERKKTGLFILEGLRELEIASNTGYTIDTILYCEDILENFDTVQTFNADQHISVTLEVYKKLAYRDTTEGIIAIVNSKDHELSSLKFKTKNPLLLIAEAPEKPGNIGALLRTADAANLDAVLIANPKTDLYNPNIIRSSVGCIFSRNVKMGSSSEIISYLKKEGFQIYCAALSASKDYTTVDFTAPTAIVVGTEHSGLSDEWLTNSTQNIIIPMEGEIDSMNVSVSAAILIFEAKRQRKIN